MDKPGEAKRVFTSQASKSVRTNEGMVCRVSERERARLQLGFFPDYSVEKQERLTMRIIIATCASLVALSSISVQAAPLPLTEGRPNPTRASGRRVWIRVSAQSLAG